MIQVGYIFTLLTFEVLMLFIVFIITTSFASSGSDTMVTTDLGDAFCKLSRTVEQPTSSHFGFLSLSQRHSVIPKGTQLQFEKDAPSSQIFYTKLWMMPFSETAWKLCQLARILTASSLISQERDMLHETLYNLQQNTNYQEFEAILNQFHFKL